MSVINQLKAQKQQIIAQYAKPSNRQGAWQTLTTLVPLLVLWILIDLSASISYWIIPLILVCISLFLLRVFVLMHECGHGSLFKNKQLNVFFGFIFGVLSGMPQFVWSRHHRYHHSTNGNWEKYRGPLNIITRDDYLAKTLKQQKQYCRARSIWLAPLAGLSYLIINPRLSCLKASTSLIKQIVHEKISQPNLSLYECAKEFNTPYCASLEEYFHMLANNIVLISLWIGMAFLLGPSLFFICYLTSLSFAGGLGIILFTVQHNFEHAYASNDSNWDYHQAAIEGTSYLVLPHWLNWFTANIGYHHIHHLSASIPNYELAACHHQHPHLFAQVTHIHPSQVPATLRYILWDTQARTIISTDEAT